MSKRFELRFENKIKEQLENLAKKHKTTQTEIVTSIIKDYLEKPEKEEFLKFNFKLQNTNSNNKVQGIRISLKEIDIDALEQLSQYYSLSKSKCVSKLLAMYVRREITMMSYEVGVIDDLSKALRQLRGIATNINQQSVVLNEWRKKSNWLEEPYPSEAREFIKSIKALSLKININMNRIEKALDLAKQL